MLNYAADLGKFALAWATPQGTCSLASYGTEEEMRARMPEMQVRHDEGKGCPEKCLAVLMHFDPDLGEWVRHDTISLENS